MRVSTDALEVRIVPVTPFLQNASVVLDRETGRGAFVDPGGEPERLLEAARELGVEIERILLTHGHLDHVGATGTLARELGVPVEGPHEGDRFWIEALREQARTFGLPDPEPFEPDRWLSGGERVRVGSLELQTLHCPGHTPGHVAFFHSASRLGWVGDVLFAGSVGRTDFPGGDGPTLLHSIREVLLPLGDDVTFVPGHGPLSTFGRERRTNPFLVGSIA